MTPVGNYLQVVKILGTKPASKAITRANDWKLSTAMFKLEMRLIFLIEKMIKHWNKLPKAAAAPLSLVICRARLAASLKDDSVKHELLGSIAG